MAELKPCPFCGNEARVTEMTMGEDYEEYTIECKGCGATIYKRTEYVLARKYDPITMNYRFVNSGIKTDMDAFDLWNRRVSDGTDNM